MRRGLGCRILGDMNFLSVSFLIGLLGCSQATLQSRPATAAERQAIVDATRIAAAVRNVNASGIAREFTADATMLPAGGPRVDGRMAIEKMFAAYLTSSGMTRTARSRPNDLRRQRCSDDMTPR